MYKLWNFQKCNVSHGGIAQVWEKVIDKRLLKLCSRHHIYDFWVIKPLHLPPKGAYTKSFNANHHKHGPQ